MSRVHMTDEEACDRGFWAQKVWSRRIADLKQATGAYNVPWSARERHWYDPAACTRFCEITFDSKAWTG